MNEGQKVTWLQRAVDLLGHRMRVVVGAIALPMLALILVSCVFHHHTDQKDLLIYSPNGEALTGGPLGHPACAVAVARWLDQIDVHHDGYITLDEYLADANRQFRVMDLDRTGVLTPEELARYRTPFGGGISGHSGDDRADGNVGTDDRPDPVMAADSQAKFEVSLPEFIDYERQYFLALDGGQSGRVARDVFLQLCAQNS